MRLETSTAICILFSANAVFAQASQYWGENKSSQMVRPEYAASMAECQRVRHVAPVRVQATECDAEKLYYGIGIPRDLEKARACALQHLGKGWDPFDGAGLLTMIHANGRGGARDLDLAIHYACRMGGAPAEMAGRIERLMRIKAGEEKAGRFSVCDDATSGFLAGRCAVHAQRIVRADREMRFAALAAQLGEREKPAFAQLRAAAEIYANKSAGGEIDRSGTMRVAFVVARQAEVLSGFTTLLFALEDRRTPRPGVSFVDIDARLNTIYQGIMASAFPPSGIPGGIERNGIRNAERAWIAYRDSWVAFAMARYPWLDSSLLKAHLTEERVAFLENIEAMVD